MNESERKAFFQAIREGDCARVEQLLQTQPELISATEDKGSPLHFATIENKREIVDLLLAHGADLNARDGEFNMTPAGWANEKGHLQMVQYLFERGAVVNLYSAAAFGLIDRVRQCLSKEQDSINEKQHYGTALHEASLWGHPEIVKLLIASGADPGLTN
jgi:uncharacterized protein